MVKFSHGSYKIGKKMGILRQGFNDPGNHIVVAVLCSH